MDQLLSNGVNLWYIHKSHKALEKFILVEITLDLKGTEYEIRTSDSLHT